MGASLLILAAGMGSRYGGLKQIDEFGPHGESLLEYAVYDALQAGFDHIVFIIREDFVKAFREKFIHMLEACPKYDLVFQEMDPRYPNIEIVEREKPWGTLHAALSAAEVVDQPFAVINADDWYGTRSYALLMERLKDIEENQSFLVGYVLGNTLSNHGAVNRGVCKVDENNFLIALQERYKIRKQDSMICDRDGYHLTGNEVVAMTFMGFHHTFLDQMAPVLKQFIEDNNTDTTCELPITNAMDPFVHTGKLSCEVIYSPDSWQGVTNPEDKPKVQKAFDEMIEQKIYPQHLRG